MRGSAKQADGDEPIDTPVTVGGMLRAFAGLGVLKLSSLGLGMISSILVTRSLGPAGYGTVTLAFAVLHLLAIPSGTALIPLLVRQTAAYVQNGDWALLSGLLAWTRVWASRLALGVAAAVACGAWVVSSGEPKGVAWLLLIGAPSIVLWMLASRVSGVLQGLRRVVLAQAFDWLVNPVLYLVVVVLLLWFDAVSPTTVMTGSILALLVSVVAGVAALRLNLRRRPETMEFNSDASAWPRAWRRFAVLHAMSVGNLGAPVILLGALTVEAEVGTYRAAENVALLLSTTLLIANSVVAPHFSRLHATGDLAGLRVLARRVARMAFLTTLPAVAFVLVFGEWLLEALFGSAYTIGYSALAILAIGQALSVGCGSVGLLFSMTGHEKFALNAQIGALALNLVVGTALIPMYGAAGAAGAAAISTVAWNVILLTRTRRLLGFSPAVV